MHLRLLSLVFRWNIADAYEREATKAVRAYLCALLPLAVLNGVFFWSIGTFIFFDVLHGAIFALTIFFLMLLIARHEETRDTFSSEVKETFDAHLTWSEFLFSIGERFSVPNMPRVYLANLNHYQAGIGNFRGQAVIIIDKQLVKKCDPYALQGVVCHEVAHALLPFGRSLYNGLTGMSRAYVDAALLHARSMADRATWRASVMHFICTELLRDPPSKRGKFWSIWSSWLWIFSTHRVSHYREYACDALSVLLLRSAMPTIMALEFLDSTTLVVKFPALSLHPPPIDRIVALQIFHNAVTQTH